MCISASSSVSSSVSRKGWLRSGEPYTAPAKEAASHQGLGARVAHETLEGSPQGAQEVFQKAQAQSDLAKLLLLFATAGLQLRLQVLNLPVLVLHPTSKIIQAFPKTGDTISRARACVGTI